MDAITLFVITPRPLRNLRPFSSTPSIQHLSVSGSLYSPLLSFSVPSFLQDSHSSPLLSSRLISVSSLLQDSSKSSPFVKTHFSPLLSSGLSFQSSPFYRTLISVLSFLRDSHFSPLLSTRLSFQSSPFSETPISVLSFRQDSRSRIPPFLTFVLVPFL